jgi:hypothetical protein
VCHHSNWRTPPFYYILVPTPSHHITLYTLTIYLVSLLSIEMRLSVLVLNFSACKVMLL